MQDEAPLHITRRRARWAQEREEGAVSTVLTVLRVLTVLSVLSVLSRLSSGEPQAGRIQVETPILGSTTICKSR